VEEEISLRALIEGLLKWKWLIAIITIVAVLISGGLSFFVLAPTYEATTTLWVNLPELNIIDEAGTPLSAIVESMVQNWRMSMESYQIIIMNSVILTKVIDRLQLDPEKFDVAALQGAITVVNPRDTNLLQINVTNDDPKLAQKIANALAEEFVLHIRKENQMLLRSSAEVLMTQVVNEEQRLNTALESYEQFLSQPKGVTEIQQEIDVKTGILTDFKARLVTKRIELESNLKGLEVTQAQLEITPQKLVTSKSLVNDPFLQDVVGQRLNARPEETALLSMKSEEINSIYLDLEQKVNDFSLKVNQLNAEEIVIRQSIETIQIELESLQVVLAQKEAEQNKLLTDIDQLSGNYDLLSSKYEEARIAASLEPGDTRISIVAPAQEPINPIAPRKMLNLAIAGVLGLMLSVFLAFFLEYWRTSATIRTGLDTDKQDKPANTAMQARQEAFAD